MWRGGFQVLVFPSVHWYFPSPWLQFTAVSESYKQGIMNRFQDMWKTVCAHFFLRNCVHDIFKMVCDLKFFTYLGFFLLISKCLFPNIYWKSTFISFRLLTLSKIEFFIIPPPKPLAVSTIVSVLVTSVQFSFCIHGGLTADTKFMDTQIPFIKWCNICMSRTYICPYTLNHL